MRFVRNHCDCEVNSASAKPARRAWHEGREYLVAPMVLLREGVLAGSAGALFYPADEIASNHRDWNGTPIVVYHPTDSNGTPTSAKNAGNSIGEVRGARIGTGGKLQAEGWFDAEKTRNTDGRVYDALLQGKALDVSTGLYTTNEPARNGATYCTALACRSYTHVARNLKPDHLAVLPDMAGACAIEDGCGLLMVNRLSEPLAIPELVFNADDPDDDVVVNTDPTGPLEIPTINWAAVQQAERRKKERQKEADVTANAADDPADDLDGPLRLPDW